MLFCGRERVACSFFFFSSRRRHTRCYRDWSSDVCSSDLLLPGKVVQIALGPTQLFVADRRLDQEVRVTLRKAAQILHAIRELREGVRGEQQLERADPPSLIRVSGTGSKCRLDPAHAGADPLDPSLHLVDAILRLRITGLRRRVLLRQTVELGLNRGQSLAGGVQLGGRVREDGKGDEGCEKDRCGDARDDMRSAYGQPSSSALTGAGLRGSGAEAKFRRKLPRPHRGSQQPERTAVRARSIGNRPRARAQHTGYVLSPGWPCPKEGDTCELEGWGSSSVRWSLVRTTP